MCPTSHISDQLGHPSQIVLYALACACLQSCTENMSSTSEIKNKQSAKPQTAESHHQGRMTDEKQHQYVLNLTLMRSSCRDLCLRQYHSGDNAQRTNRSRKTLTQQSWCALHQQNQVSDDRASTTRHAPRCQGIPAIACSSNQ